ESEFTRNRLKGFMSPEDCDACHGQRLKPEILSITLGDTVLLPPNPNLNPNRNLPPTRNPSIPGLSIMDLCALSIDDADAFFANLKLPPFEERIATEVIKEVRARLGFLKNVGLGYLTLNRESGTLSGGEAQRIRLATQIGAGLVGVLYI